MKPRILSAPELRARGVIQYLDGPPHDHYSIMQGPFCLFHKLLSATTEDDGACLGLRAASEEIVPMPRIQWCTHELLSPCYLISMPSPSRRKQLTQAVNSNLEGIF